VERLLHFACIADPEPSGPHPLHKIHHSIVQIHVALPKFEADFFQHSFINVLTLLPSHQNVQPHALREVPPGQVVAFDAEVCSGDAEDVLNQWEVGLNECEPCPGPHSGGGRARWAWVYI
jgi:hypothetical protein